MTSESSRRILLVTHLWRADAQELAAGVATRLLAAGVGVSAPREELVDTPLSRPFQANVPDGRLFTPRYAAQRLLGVIDALEAPDSGNVFAWDGQRVPF